MNLDDLARLVRVGGPQVSPDGKSVAYTVAHVDSDDDKGYTELWMVSWDGTDDIQLTYGTESASDPRWSPDNRYLAFTSSRPGKAKGDQVWLLDRRGGEARQLTEVKEDLDDYRWSPDSKQLLLSLKQKLEPDDDKGQSGKPKPPKPIVLDRYHFKQDEEGYISDLPRLLYTFDIASKKLTKLTDDTHHEERGAEWSPDGQSIAFVSNHDLPDPDRTSNSDIFVVSSRAGSTPRRLTTFTGSDEGPLSWSADSQQILYRHGLSPKFNIYDTARAAVISAANGTSRTLAESLDRGVDDAVFALGDHAVLATVEDDQVEYVTEFDLKTGTPTRLTNTAGVARALSQGGGHIALLWTTDTIPPEIYALDGDRLRKLTSHNDVLLAQLNIALPREVTAKSKDSVEVHGLLTMPPAYIPGDKVPMLLEIHGGPTSQDAHSFSAQRQLFAAHGYAVLNVNYRGSTGRGRTFGEIISADWGHHEVDDLLACVDAAIATGSIDPNRLLIGGWSYGGILTDYTIATDTRFKAASSGAGTGNLFGMYGIDQYILQYDNELGPPWKVPETYIKLSYPFFHVERIKTPTLFMGGDKDFNVTLAGGEQMYQALKSTGVPAELIVYPGQFHGFTRPSFIRDRYQRWFDWYDHYIGKPVASTQPTQRSQSTSSNVP